MVRKTFKIHKNPSFFFLEINNLEEIDLISLTIYSIRGVFEEKIISLLASQIFQIATWQIKVNLLRSMFFVRRWWWKAIKNSDHLSWKYHTCFDPLKIKYQTLLHLQWVQSRKLGFSLFRSCLENDLKVSNYNPFCPMSLFLCGTHTLDALNGDGENLGERAHARG